MARIRTVKPGFFRHEKLQELEVENPGKYIMLVFQGLWMLSDSKGKFLYKPRTIKLDVLPFIPFEIKDTLDILEREKFIEVYEVKGEKYGLIPSFNEHQRLSGKESSEGEKYPNPEVKQEGSNWEATGKHPGAQEGKGKEGKGEVSPKLISQYNMKDCKLSKDDPERQVYETSVFLYDKFKEKMPHNKDLPLQQLVDWVTPVRSLLLKKEYSHDQVCTVARWAVNEKFWKNIVLNTQALEKNFETIKIQYQNEQSKSTT